MYSEEREKERERERERKRKRERERERKREQRVGPPIMEMNILLFHVSGHASRPLIFMAEFSSLLSLQQSGVADPFIIYFEAFFPLARRKYSQSSAEETFVFACVKHNFIFFEKRKKITREGNGFD